MNVRKAFAMQGKFRFALNQPALLFADARAPEVAEPVPLTTLGDRCSYDEGAQDSDSGFAWNAEIRMGLVALWQHDPF
jgi:hypothetical protein